MIRNCYFPTAHNGQTQSSGKSPHAVPGAMPPSGSPFETGEDVFNDVNSNDYYFKAVSWATKNGITVGTGNGKFEPDMDCNRAQIVAMLYRTQR